jgi:hypothetical protein
MPGLAEAEAEGAALKLEQATEPLDRLKKRKPLAEPDAKMALKAKTAEALEKSEQSLKVAADQLLKTPGQAAQSMQQAAQAMDSAVRQFSKQAQQALPSPPARSPTAGLNGGGRKGSPAGAGAAQLEAFNGKAWGELPGELKTRLVQDLRARYGDDYAPIIQRYFEGIADLDGARNKKSP